MMVKQAIREQWPITESMRAEVIAGVHQAAVDEGTDIRYRLAAAKVLTMMDAVNVKRETAEEESRHHETIEQIQQFRAAMSSAALQGAVGNLARDGCQAIAGEPLAIPEAEKQESPQIKSEQAILTRDALGTEPSASTIGDGAKPNPIVDNPPAAADDFNLSRKMRASRNGRKANQIDDTGGTPSPHP
jgi:hypothetical protein